MTYVTRFAIGATWMLCLCDVATAASELTKYKNTQYGFSFSYPSSWAQETPRSAMGVVKIVSASGNGEAACNMIVQRSPALKNISTQQAVKSLSPAVLIGEFKRGGVNDAEVIESGLTKVFNRDAYYAILTYSIQTMGEKIPMKTLQIVTTKSEVVYTFTCGTAVPDSFIEVYPVFRLIIGSLFIDP